MKAKEMHLNLYDLHTAQLNETDSDIYLCGSSYYKGEPIELCVVFNDMTFLEFVSHDDINRIKENLKKRIDNL